MLIHSRMLNGHEQDLSLDELKRGSDLVWRQWKEREERRR